jgi:predicted O-linked N-acetylglucosamine transferase (SPINDLY family)
MNHQAQYIQAVTLHQQGRLNEAQAIYEALLADHPGHADVLHLLGVIAAQTGNHQRAADLIAKAIALNPGNAGYYANRGNALLALKQYAAAIDCYDQAIKLQPDFADAYGNRGISLQMLGRFADALASYQRAVSIRPDYAQVHFWCGVVLQELRQLQAAIDSYSRAISIRPDYVEACYNRGTALQELKEWQGAIASYDQAIHIKPDYHEAYFNRGVALKAMKSLDAAVSSYDAAIRIKPDYAEAINNRGNALQELNQLDAAVASYDRALIIKPDYADAHFNRGKALHSLSQLEAAIASYSSALKLKPDYDYLFGLLLNTRMKLCDWTGYQEQITGLMARLERGMKCSSCFTVLGLTDSLAAQRKAAEILVSDKHPANDLLGSIPKRARSPKIRIGYYSADFHNHATSILIAGLLEQHDRNRFELIGFSFGPDRQDEMRQRVSAAFDQFIDVRMKSDQEVAQLSRLLGIDIAVDLKGYTQDNRMGIFSYRAAPVQVSYLGYPGTVGAPYMDYLIADRTLVPELSQKHYSEKIVYLPGSYQVNDRKRRISERIYTRAEVGLPEQGFVFCCFNNNYKITPEVFDSWVRILNAVPGSVLWLFEDHATASTNLRKEAAQRGLDPNRLVFATQMMLSEHLARHRLADLFLDTLPYNAHTTASDALWAGLPVLTQAGESFAARVAASLLNAIGLPELITETQTEYESLAIELAHNPARLSALKVKLEQNRLTAPLFDTNLYTRNLEAAYSAMYERYQADLPPEHIYLSDQIVQK